MFARLANGLVGANLVFVLLPRDEKGEDKLRPYGDEEGEDELRPYVEIDGITNGREGEHQVRPYTN